MAVAAALLVVALSGQAVADEFAPTEADRAAIGRCIEDVGEALEAGADAPGDRNDCIGVASGPCLDDERNQSTVGQVMCLARESAIWDEFLNRDYNALREKLTAATFERLQDTQRKWIAYRDANCAMPHAFFEGGTMAQPIGAHCIMEMTARRANELAVYLDWAGL